MSDTSEQTKMKTASLCPRCGGPFVCGSVAGTPDCWCAGFPVLQGVSRESESESESALQASCYCAACLRELLAQTNSD